MFEIKLGMKLRDLHEAKPAMSEILQLNEQRRRAYGNEAELHVFQRKLNDELTLRLQHLNKLAGRILEDGAGILEDEQRDGGGDESAGAGAGPSGVYTGGPDDAMNEIEDLRTFDMWTNFVSLVRDAIKGAPRHALAQHVTTSCQPHRMPGVSVSLNSCGADEVHQRNGMHECHVALENLLEPGDGLALNYVSVGHTRFKDAQVAAFVEILSYILFLGPRYLRTHENQWYAGRLQAVKSDAESQLRIGLGPRGVSARAPSGQRSPLAAPATPEESQATRTTSFDIEFLGPEFGLVWQRL